MKNTKSIPNDNKIQRKNTEPDDKLKVWFQKRLELEKKFTKTDPKQSRKTEGEIKELTRERNSSNSRKTEMLDKIIFPSLANLVYFAETLESNPELQNLFENDLKDLIDIRSRDADGMSDYFYSANTHFPSMRLSSNNIVRLISSLLCLRNDEKHDLNNNFRNKILNELNKIICAKSLKILNSKPSDYDVVYETAKETLSRSIGFTMLISEKYTSQQIDENPKRSIFPPKLSK